MQNEAAGSSEEIAPPEQNNTGSSDNPAANEPPQMPENGENMFGQNNHQNYPEPENDTDVQRNSAMPFGHLSPLQYALIGAESLGISLLLFYLIMSVFNKKSFKETFYNADKITIFILATIILTVILAVMTVIADVYAKSRTPMDDSAPKETSASDIDHGQDVTDSNIDLASYNSNVTITKAGTYTLTGSFEHSVLINADGDVILNLNGVTVDNKMTAAIANISKNALFVNLADGSKNSLSDGGSSEYDACLYSIGPLTIQGEGTLNIYGNQDEGEGIATETNDITINGGMIHIECNDDGVNAGGDGGTITVNDGTIYIKASGDGIDSNKDIVINGGTVYAMGSSAGGDAGIDANDGFALNGGLIIALGSDMLETPLTSSKQNTICFNLDSAIQSDTTVTLTDEADNVIASFIAGENFKTLIISSPSLAKGNYRLYQGGKNNGNNENGIYYGGKYTAGSLIAVNGQTEFNVSAAVTQIGSGGHR